MKTFRAPIFKNAIPASFNRQMVAHLIDGLAMMIVLTFALIGANSFVASTQAYITSESALNQERIAVYQIEEEAKVYQFLNNQNGQYETLRPLEDIFADYVLKHVLLSYSIDPAPFSTYSVVIDNPTNLQPASYEQDQLAYFYVSYATQYNQFEQQTHDVVNFESDTPEVFYYRTLKRLSPDVDYWVLDEVNYTFPHLKSAFAVDLYIYLFEDENHQAGLTNYNKLAVAYQAIWQEQVAALVSSQRFSNHFNQYLYYYEICSRIIQLSSIITYGATFLLVYLLPQFWMKNMQTFGKKIMKIKVIDVEGYSLLPRQFILRNVISFFLYGGALLLPMILTGGFQSGMMYPVITISGIGISLFHISIFAIFLAVIFSGAALFSNLRSSLNDILNHTVMMDDRYTDVLLEVENKTN